MQSEVENKDKKAADLYYLFSKYKTLASQSPRCTRFSWLQKVANVSFIIKFSCPNFPSSEGCEVIGDSQALFILRNIKSDFEKDLSGCLTFEDVLRQLELLLQSTEERSLSAAATRRILQEILSLGWGKLSSASADLSRLHLTSAQQTERDGDLVVILPPDFPTSPLSLEHDLPPCWSPPTSSLLALHSSWEAALEDYRPAWRELEEVDRLCLVLDSGSTKLLHRRLAVRSAVSLYLELDPTSPTAIPTIRFMGSTHSTEQLRRSWVDNIDLWDDDDPVLTNLERVLGLEFPSKQSLETESQSSVECGICLEDCVEGEFPCLTCEDDECEASYHSSCLYQWLLRAPTRRAVSGIMTGRCPLCQGAIMCSKPCHL